MSRKKKINSQEEQMPKVHKDLEGFDIKINAFGEILSTLDIDVINAFLDKNVSDKKLKGNNKRKEEKKQP